MLSIFRCTTYFHLPESMTQHQFRFNAYFFIVGAACSQVNPFPPPSTISCRITALFAIIQAQIPYHEIPS